MAATEATRPLTQDQIFLLRRRLFVGGSDAASQFNEGWGCYRRLVMDKRGMPDDFVRPEREQRILERGHKFEDLAAQDFAEATGFKIQNQGSRVYCTNCTARAYLRRDDLPVEPFSCPSCGTRMVAGVNIDRRIVGVTREQLEAITTPRDGDSFFAGYFEDDDIGPGVLEVKTINEHSLRRLIEDGLEKHPEYIFQIQHSFGVTGYKWGFFVFMEPTSLNGSVKGCPYPLYFPFKRNEALIELDLMQVPKTWELVSDWERPLPEGTSNLKVCRSCLKRRTCKGEAGMAELAGIEPAEFDKGYTKNNDPRLVTIANLLRDDLALQEEADAKVANDIAAIQEVLTELKLDKVDVEAAAVKFIWQERAGAVRWDGKALQGELDKLKKDEPERFYGHLLNLEADLRKQGRIADADKLALHLQLDVEKVTALLAKCKTTTKASRPFNKYIL